MSTSQIMTPGRFIAFEGGEGAGKSTQSRLLTAYLRGHGIDVVSTREPGGTPGAEAIRGLLLNGVDTPQGSAGWGARAEALLFAAARADHVETLIRPALARGAWVVCDRYLDSSRAYQGGGSGLSDDQIVALHAIGSEGFLPDLTILVEVSPATAAARLAIRDPNGTDRIGSRGQAYHARVADTFARLADEAPDRYARVDGNGDAEATFALIRNAVSRLTGFVA